MKNRGKKEIKRKERKSNEPKQTNKQIIDSIKIIVIAMGYNDVTSIDQQEIGEGTMYAKDIHYTAPITMIIYIFIRHKHVIIILIYIQILQGKDCK